MSQLQGVQTRQADILYIMSKPAAKQAVISAPDHIQKTDVAQLLVRYVSGAVVKITGK